MVKSPFFRHKRQVRTRSSHTSCQAKGQIYKNLQPSLCCTEGLERAGQYIQTYPHHSIATEHAQRQRPRVTPILTASTRLTHVSDHEMIRRESECPAYEESRSARSRLSWTPTSTDSGVHCLFREAAPEIGFQIQSRLLICNLRTCLLHENK